MTTEEQNEIVETPDNVNPEDVGGENTTTAEDLSGGNEEDVYETIAKLTGFKYEDEQFSDDVEGYSKFATKTYAKGKQDAFAELQTEHPDIYDLLEYKKAGGNPLDLLSKKQGVEVQMSSEEDYKKVCATYLKSTGVEDEDVKRLLETWEDAGLLETKATLYQSKLKELEGKEWEKQLEQQKQVRAYIKQEEDKAVALISSHIEKGEAGTFIINNADKKAFQEEFLNSVFIQPDEQGKIKYYYSRELNPSDLQSELMIEYLRFKKGNLKDIVAKQVQKAQVQQLKRNTNSNNNKQEQEDNTFSLMHKALGLKQ